MNKKINKNLNSRPKDEQSFKCWEKPEMDEELNRIKNYFNSRSKKITKDQPKTDIHPGQQTLGDEYKRVSSVQHFPPR